MCGPTLHPHRQHTVQSFDCAPPLQLEMATAFGAFLDPVADKLMVSTALILLAAGPPAPLGSAAMAVPALVVIGREIAMSSLREWAASSGGGASKVHVQ